MSIKFQSDLDAGTVSDDLLGVFETEGYPLWRNATVEEIEGNWVITDNSRKWRRYTITLTV
jgi:hypothetical protein